MKKKKEPIENPIVAFRPRKFACSKWPFMRIPGGLRFERGFLTITDEKGMESLERVPEYHHGQIVEIREKRGKDKTPTIEESAELAALAAIAEGEPRAHTGAVSTKNLY